MKMTSKQRRYQAYIKEAEQSGIPLAVYAKQQGVAVQCLYGEKYRAKKIVSGSPSDFVRVKDVSEPLMSTALMQIRLPNGITLALPTHHVPVTEMLQILAKF